MSAPGAFEPGSFFLTPVTGWFGVLIRVGQFLAGRPSRYQHAGVIIDDFGTTVEAEWGGAKFGHVGAYADRKPYICDLPVQQAAVVLRRLSGAPDNVEELVRATVATKGKQLGPSTGRAGVPYSALDYVALALLHLHLPSRWVRQRVEGSGHMICSQLVDAVYERAGIHLYNDGRLPGDVMPADLAEWARAHGGTP